MSAKKYNRVDGISRAAYPFLFGEEIDDNGLDGPTLSGKEIGSKIPGIGDAVEIGTDLGVCNSDCQGNPNSHVCTEDKYECNNEGFWVWLTGPESIVYKCNAETGMYYAGTVHQKCPCFAKCVMDDAGVPHCQDCPPKAGNVSAVGA